MNATAPMTVPKDEHRSHEVNLNVCTRYLRLFVTGNWGNRSITQLSQARAARAARARGGKRAAVSAENPTL